MYDMADLQWGLDVMHIRAAHTVSRGAGVKVAVIDSGVDARHPDLEGQLLDGYVWGRGAFSPLRASEFRDDSEGHGTHVTGIIVAKDDGHGVMGVAPDARVIPIDVGDVIDDFSDVEKTASVLAKAVRLAVDAGARVVSMSLGVSEFDATPTEVAPLCTAIADVTNAGALVVVAAGNSGDESNPVMFPASCPGSLSVAALNERVEASAWASFENTVGVAAPGVEIVSTIPFSNDPSDDQLLLPYASFSGSSMAAPAVAGIAALLFSQDSSRSGADVRSIIVASAHDLLPQGVDAFSGSGVVDAARALGLEALPPTPALVLRAKVADFVVVDGCVECSVVAWRPAPTITTGFTVELFSDPYMTQASLTTALPPSALRFVFQSGLSGFARITQHTPSGDLRTIPLAVSSATSIGFRHSFDVTAVRVARVSPTKINVIWKVSGDTTTINSIRVVVRRTDGVTIASRRVQTTRRILVVTHPQMAQFDIRAMVELLTSSDDGTSAYSKTSKSLVGVQFSRTIRAGESHTVLVGVTRPWLVRGCKARSCEGAAVRIYANAKMIGRSFVMRGNSFVVTLPLTLGSRTEITARVGTALSASGPPVRLKGIVSRAD